MWRTSSASRQAGGCADSRRCRTLAATVLQADRQTATAHAGRTAHGALADRATVERAARRHRGDRSPAQQAQLAMPAARRPVIAPKPKATVNGRRSMPEKRQWRRAQARRQTGAPARRPVTFTSPSNRRKLQATVEGQTVVGVVNAGYRLPGAAEPPASRRHAAKLRQVDPCTARLKATRSPRVAPRHVRRGISSVPQQRARPRRLRDKAPSPLRQRVSTAPDHAVKRYLAPGQRCRAPPAPSRSQARSARRSVTPGDRRRRLGRRPAAAQGPSVPPPCQCAAPRSRPRRVRHPGSPPRPGN